MPYVLAQAADAEHSKCCRRPLCMLVVAEGKKQSEGEGGGQAGGKGMQGGEGGG